MMKRTRPEEEEVLIEEYEQPRPKPQPTKYSNILFENILRIMIESSPETYGHLMSSGSWLSLRHVSRGAREWAGEAFDRWPMVLRRDQLIDDVSDLEKRRLLAAEIYHHLQRQGLVEGSMIRLNKLSWGLLGDIIRSAKLKLDNFGALQRSWFVEAGVMCGGNKDVALIGATTFNAGDIEGTVNLTPPSNSWGTGANLSSFVRRVDLTGTGKEARAGKLLLLLNRQAPGYEEEERGQVSDMVNFAGEMGLAEYHYGGLAAIDQLVTILKLVESGRIEGDALKQFYTGHGGGGRKKLEAMREKKRAIKESWKPLISKMKKAYPEELESIALTDRWITELKRSTSSFEPDEYWRQLLRNALIELFNEK